MAPSVDASDLAVLLARIPSDRGSTVLHTTTQYPSPSRSSTVEHAENATQDYQTKFYQALLDDGGKATVPHQSASASLEECGRISRLAALLEGISHMAAG
jgi:hypothetical protein